MVKSRYSEFQPQTIPRAPDGGPAPGFGMVDLPDIPEFTPENCVCLRGPCRHLWLFVTTAGEGNPKGTWESLGLKQPRQRRAICLLSPSEEMDLADDCVFECGRWDPLTDGELAEINARRELYQIRAAREAPTEDLPLVRKAKKTKPRSRRRTTRRR